MSGGGPLSSDMDDLRALGHGALALFSSAVLLSIVAVVVASGQSANAVGQFFSLLAWLVARIVTPVTGGRSVVLDASAGDAASTASTAATSGGSSTADAPFDVSGAGGAASGGAGGSTGGTTSATLPAGWHEVYQSGDTFSGETEADGTVVFGYHKP